MISTYTYTCTLFSFIALLFNSTISCFVVSNTGGGNANGANSFHSTSTQLYHTADPTSTTSTTSTQLDDSKMITHKVQEKSLVRNFRLSAGLRRIYRCANTDDLGILFAAAAAAADDDDHNNEFDGGDSNDENNGACALQQVPQQQYDVSSPEHTLLHNAGLILDLRSSSERNEAKARSWMSKAPGGKIDVKKFERGGPTLDFSTGSGSRNKSEAESAAMGSRSVYRIDVLSPRRLFDYLADNWLTSPILKAQYSFSFAFDTQKLHEIRMDILNDKGLKGLYEAIIETSGEELCASLKAITEYLESHPEGDVIVHCVQGKDRTGLVVMLCQSMLGIDDVTIIQDYHKSEMLLKLGKEDQGSASGSGSGSAAANIVGKEAETEEEQVKVKENKGKLNRKFFSGAPEEAMVSTLALIREKYGTINNYLDNIGFDDTWRRRFIASQQRDTGDLKSRL